MWAIVVFLHRATLSSHWSFLSTWWMQVQYSPSVKVWLLIDVMLVPFLLVPESHYKEKLQRRCCKDGLREIPMPYSCVRRSLYITEGWECMRAFRYCCATYRNQEFDTNIPTTTPPTTTPPSTTSAPMAISLPRPNGSGMVKVAARMDIPLTRHTFGNYCSSTLSFHHVWFLVCRISWNFRFWGMRFTMLIVLDKCVRIKLNILLILLNTSYS